MNDLTPPSSAVARLRLFLALFLASAASLLFAPNAFAQDLDDLREMVEEFQEAAQALYRLDEDARLAIWEAYCGLYDPSTEMYDFRFATEIGRRLQSEQEDRWEDARERAEEVIELLDEFIEDEVELQDEGRELLEVLNEENLRLQELEAGLVLRGSNHPFVQFAIDYGIRMHQAMCSAEGEDPRVCDTEWPGFSGRPDLVYVDDDGLWVVEFKPDSERAIRAGQEQVLDYVGYVENYFQQYFPNGREGGYQGTPDDDYGGEELLRKLAETPDAWSSDGQEIEAQWEVLTYDRCEQRF